MNRQAPFQGEIARIYKKFPSTWVVELIIIQTALLFYLDSKKLSELANISLYVVYHIAFVFQYMHAHYLNKNIFKLSTIMKILHV